MKFAQIAVTASLVAALSACSKGSDSPVESTSADSTSGMDSDGTNMDRDMVGHTPEMGSTDTASGAGSNAPSTGMTGGAQPTGPGTAGENVTTGGPGVPNSPSGATGSVNSGAGY